MLAAMRRLLGVKNGGVTKSTTPTKSKATSATKSTATKSKAKPKPNPKSEPTLKANKRVSCASGGSTHANASNAPTNAPTKNVSGDPSFLSQAAFDDLPIHKDTKRALAEEFGYKHLSAPQAEYLPVVLAGNNVFIKAKTGSGKTLGFLIPVLERITRSSRMSQTNAQKTNAPKTNAQKTNVAAAMPVTPVRALVISPSRELADQTRKEALRLSRFHASVGVQMVIGGTDAGAERRRLQRENADILVATPGRLIDHIENLPGLVDSLRKHVRCVVIDEADRLLDMGFLPALKKIFAVLPPPSRRQALLFTATVPDGVKEIASTLSPEFKYIDTSHGSNDDEVKASHDKIDQGYAVLPVAELLPALHRVLLAKRRANKDHRIIVFFTTARTASFTAALFRKCPHFSDVLELHSRLSQGQRNRTTATFSAKKGLVLFASDVIARGIDFPDVTFVGQVGLTDPQQYEHRVGRTGRAGKSGEAMIFLCDDEAGLVRRLLDAKLPLHDSTALAKAQSPGKTNVNSPKTTKTNGNVGNPKPNTDNWTPGDEASFAAAVAKVSSDPQLQKAAEQAYAATLGFYASNMKKLGWSAADVVRSVNARFLAAGLKEVPAIDPKTAAKMHLKDAPGLRLLEGTQKKRF